MDESEEGPRDNEGDPKNIPLESEPWHLSIQLHVDLTNVDSDEVQEEELWIKEEVRSYITSIMKTIHFLPSHSTWIRQ